MIYCVEDDEGIRNMMLYTLKVSGFEAVGFSCAEELYEELGHRTPKLIMLDIMLPDEDGLSILKRLKSGIATMDIPVIMATAKGTEYDKVWGLDLGADDYLAKPFGMMEMVSRVKAVLRRTTPSNQQILTLGTLTLNVDAHTVTAGANQVTLTLKEFDLLRTMMHQPSMVFTRDQLLSRVWEMDYDGETRTVDTHIRTLRTKLGDCGDYIATVRGVGYRMEELP